MGSPLFVLARMAMKLHSCSEAMPRWWASLRSQLDAGALADIQYNSAYWEQWESPIDTVSSAIYDTMLKSYGQADGIQSYGTVVDLLVAYY